jgi:hypothetical protein
LNSSRPIPVGARVRCPHCHETFRVTAEVPAPAPAEALVPAARQEGQSPPAAHVAHDDIPVAEMVDDEPQVAAVAELDDEETTPLAKPQKKHRPRSIGIWLCVALILVAIMFGTAAALYYGVSKARVALALASGSAIAGWEPDPVLVQFLDEEVTVRPLDRLHIRVSKKAPMQSHVQDRAADTRITQLGSAMDGEGTTLVIDVREKPPGLELDPRVMQLYLRNWLPNGSNPETGSINGLSFTRMRIDGPNGAKGFTYFGVVDDHIVVLSSLESPEHLPRLRLAESAVLTLRKDQ